MTYDLLKDLRIVEVSAFVAAPLAGLTLAQLGAEVIRIDPPGGGIDHNRWPLSQDGTSLFWAGLNRAKRSISVDLKSDEGQGVLHRLLKGGGRNGGILLTNLTGPDWMSFESLRRAREDLIHVELKGHFDGKPAVDYTVNPTVGLPLATGPEGYQGPINSVLPSWDGMAGLSLATAILAAVHARGRDSGPQHLTVALSDVAYGLVGNLGMIAEAELSGASRPRIGNSLFGAFGTDLPTSDGRFVMVVAITKRQWHALLDATDSKPQIDEIGSRLELDFTTDAGRYKGRKEIGAVFKAWSAKRSFSEVCETLLRTKALWGPYQTFTQMLDEDVRLTSKNPLIQVVDNGSVGTFRVPGSPIRVSGSVEGRLSPASRRGTDTRSVLKNEGFTDEEIEQLCRS